MWWLLFFFHSFIGCSSCDIQYKFIIQLKKKKRKKEKKRKGKKKQKPKRGRCNGTNVPLYYCICVYACSPYVYVCYVLIIVIVAPSNKWNQKTTTKIKQNKQKLVLTEYANQSHNFTNLIFVTSSLLFSIVQNGRKKLSWTGCLPCFLRRSSYVSEKKRQLLTSC